APKQQLGSYAELFRDPRWRKHALLGLVLGCSGIIGLWSVGFFTPDLIRYVQRKGVASEVYFQRITEAKEKKDDALAEQWTEIQKLEEAGKPIPTDLQSLQ